MITNKRVLITGANRGIGLELTRQLLAAGNRVFATCRLPEQAADLNGLKGDYASQLTIVKMDVISDLDVRAAHQLIVTETNHLDIIINNAGINPRKGLAEFNADEFLLVLNVNAVGAMRVVHQFLPLLKAAGLSKVINVSSQLGSLQIARPQFGSVDYNTSKAAMNMITRHLSFELAQFGVAVISIHPGWVQTDMGGSHAAVKIPDSASGILAVVEGISAEDNGEFFTFKGEKHPW